MKEADLSDLFARLPDGLHQRIGPDGCQLSGGERQQLAIARAILQEPRILILDEATSCIDSGSEELILGNLGRCLPGTTIIVVSHRMSTVSTCNRILLLSEGKVASDVAPTALTSNQLPRSTVLPVISPV